LLRYFSLMSIVGRKAHASRGSSLASALLRSKKEKAVRKEEPPSHSPRRVRIYLRRPKENHVLPLPPLKEEKDWWGLELDLQVTYYVPDDPEDARARRRS
jgi:hypothetical protein